MIKLLRIIIDGIEYIEQFKDIDLTKYDGEDYAGIYQVSTFGRIKSLRMCCNVHKKYVYRERILKPNINRCGYKYINLNKIGKTKVFTIHRLVAIHFISNSENKKTVNHKDGNKQNNYIDNLEWSTYSENAKHSFKMGLQNNQGENHPQHKLSNKDVIFIRKSKKEKIFKQRELSKMFGVSESVISCAILKKTWNHI